ncbi:MAG: STAS domain-containing protein [Holophagales bacterium]|nr:STAS domain-containing protein [Holophagales bacterium]
MNLTIEPQESFILARIEDSRLDALSAPDFKARMTGALTGAAPKVVLDLSPVAFIDSAGLASILSLVKGLPEGASFGSPGRATPCGPSSG